MRSFRTGYFLLALVLTGGLIAAHTLGYRINLTPSVDGLIWKIKTGTRPHRGDLVMVCLPAHFVTRHRLDEHVENTITNTCGGIVPLLKRVVGVSGDHIHIDPDGIRINHVLLPHTARVMAPAMTVDRRYRLAAGKYIVAGDTDNSLDSRYFGEIDELWIIGTARNIL